MWAKGKKMNNEVEIVVNGKPVQTYNHDGKVYIESRTGTEYGIKIKNNSYSRVLAVVTVDGINVISGQITSHEDRVGYVISARDSYVVKGYRKDNDSVGAFKFCSPSSSYAKEKGIGHNNGVIGVRIFDEVTYHYRPPFQPIKTPIEIPLDNPIPWTINRLQDMTTAIPNNSFKIYNTVSSEMNISKGFNEKLSSNTISCSSSVPEFDSATTWGKGVIDSVSETFFSANICVGEYVFFYASRKSLEDIGIKFVKEKKISFPSAFAPQFASPPKGWRG